jgi:hypothetical protein
MFGLPRYLWGLLLVGVLTAAFLWLRAAERADDKANQTIGQVTERAETTGQVLERVEQANAIRNEVEAEADRGTGDALYAECLRAQRGASEICQRFLPERPAADR